MSKHLFTREKFKSVTKIAIVIAVIVAAVQLLHIGGDTFVISFSDTVTIPLAILTVVTAYLLWRRFLPFSSGRPLWIWFLIGWGSWGISEVLYMVLFWVTGDVPYPGPPDIFYVIGYIGLIIGLQMRLRETHKQIQGWQRWILGSIFIVLLSLTSLFAIKPVIQYPSSNIWQSVLDVVYPTCDLVLILLGVRLLFDYNTRQSRNGWRLIIAGFIFMYIADLTYTFASSVGLLYPDGTVNLISTLGYSLPYDLAYALWMMGMYGLQVKLTSRIKQEAITQPFLIGNTHVLFFLDRNLSLSEVSSNYHRVFNASPKAGQDMLSLVPLSTTEFAWIKTELSKRGKFADVPVEVVNRKGTNQSAKLSGISILDGQKVFNGALIVMRLVSEVNNLDLELNEYQRSLVDQVRIMSGSNETRNVCEFLHAFFLPFFKRGYELILENAGFQQGVNFEEYLNRESSKNNWKVKIESGLLSIDEDCTPDQLIQQLPAMLDTARVQLDKVSDPESVDIELRKIRAGFSEEVMNNYYYIQHAWPGQRK